jgi:hypothetical protein
VNLNSLLKLEAAGTLLFILSTNTKIKFLLLVSKLERAALVHHSSPLKQVKIISSILMKML